MVLRPSWIYEQRSFQSTRIGGCLLISPRTEHANQAKKRDADLKIPTIVQSNDALAEPVKIPGMNYLEVNVNGKGFERSLLWQLSAWNIT